MTICARCDQQFLHISALYEHYQEAHGVPEVRYYSLVPEKPLAPSREATEWLERKRARERERWHRRNRRKAS